jgi:hypothetical protein
MSKVLIIVNAEVRNRRVSPTSPVAAKMVTALVQSIQNSTKSTEIEIIGTADLWSKSIILTPSNEDLIYCPLTIKLPDWIEFPAKHIFQLCIDIPARRSWVEKYFQYKTTIADSCLGDLWLPIVLTAKGPIYGEVIGEGEIPNFYQQPIDFDDRIRQSLYNLAYQLLDSINATPSVYLLQFRMLEKEIIFDRLWPFPASPAIASIPSQKPDLFACHWHCLWGKPIVDLTVMPPVDN